MIEIFGGVLLALVAYRILGRVATLVAAAAFKAAIERDRARGLRRNRTWSGTSSRAWRLANTLGVNVR